MILLREIGREGEGECVCVRERETVCVREEVTERKRERERERETVCVREAVRLSNCGTYLSSCIG